MTIEDDIAVALGRKAPTITEMLERLDNSDLSKLTDDYTTLANHDIEMLVERLRHRATMMRERADQLDVHADRLLEDLQRVKTLTHSLDVSIQAVEAVLTELVHIEPKRVP